MLCTTVLPNVAISYGGTGDDQTRAVTADASGNLYAVGTTNSADVTSVSTKGGRAGATRSDALGAFTGSSADGFLTKFTANGTCGGGGKGGCFVV